jgi:sigma-B regulation protein RsbU (phosphoserine phosphatase)
MTGRGDDVAAAPRAAGLGVGVAAGLLAALVGLDVLLGDGASLSAAYGCAAVAASTMSTPRRTGVVAAVAVAAAAMARWWSGGTEVEWWAGLGVSVVLAGLAVAAATTRAAAERRLQQMTVVAETAQRAVLRAMPSAVGSVGFAARYVSATEEALIGGDLYEVAASPYGVRVIVGDARGKGLDAVQMAATVIGAFRRSAFTQPSLGEIAVDLDDVVGAVAGDEDFVTALLAEFHDDHTVSLVNCGHHPPLVLSGSSRARLLPTGEPQPPLGLGAAAAPVTAAWTPGSRLLLYTDGLVETRDREGAFFPLLAHATDLRDGSLDQALDRLVARLVRHAGARVGDDLALVLAEHRPA